MEQEDKPHWTLDKRVPISLLLGLLLQSATIVWWARGQQEVSSQHSRRLDALESQRQTDRVSERLAVIEYQLGELRAAQLRVEQALLKISEETRPRQLSR
jgi:hypothetical protein